MTAAAFGLFLLLGATPVGAAGDDPPAAAQTADASITCASTGEQRVQCPANTSAGVALIRITGTGACIYNETWGYDATGVWVSKGCSGTFALGVSGASAQAPGAPTAQAPAPSEPIESWGLFEPGKGYLLARTDRGELSISAYALIRYINQLPPDQSFVDHHGIEREIDTRNDIYSHRVMVFFKGWMGVPKLRYNIILWTVNTTDQKSLFAQIGYQFSRKFSVYGGINGLPGTRSLQGSHPYWLAHDRVLADEFFRPYFTNGVWATGELLPGLWYQGMLGNNLSALGVTSKQLTRDMATAGSVWWMPTTKEFGPQGGFGDWESHEQLATRFGVSSVRSHEDRFANVATGAPDNTTLRLADSLNLFDPGALAPGVTVGTADYRMFAVDAGMKYRGVFVQTEIYHRWLKNFEGDGPIGIDSILDRGFYVQAAFFPIRKKLEVYGATSQIYGDKDAGFANSREYLAGFNVYPLDTRNHRLNVQYTDLLRSPVNSSFGYYAGGMDGGTLSVGFSIFF